LNVEPLLQASSVEEMAAWRHFRARLKNDNFGLD
jgi:hypothetical protein